MAYLILDLWDCRLYWWEALWSVTSPTRWIFAFCSCVPAVVELIIMVGVLGLKKPV